MSKGIEKISVDKIDFSLEYEGYIWYSDEDKPEIIPNSKINFEPGCFSDLPFIIEGNLYHYESDLSLQIKYIDGEYHIIKFNLKEARNAYPENAEVKYAGKKGRNYLMLEAWEEHKLGDESLEGMAFLRPSWAAFIGFIK